MKKKIQISLIIIVSIIVIMGTLFIISLNNARSHHPDTYIVTEVKQIMTAIEIYKVETGRYPQAPPADECGDLPGVIVGCCLGLESGFVKECSENEEIALDRVPGDYNRYGKWNKICPKDFRYIYRIDDELESYTVEYCLEKENYRGPGIHFGSNGKL